MLELPSSGVVRSSTASEDLKMAIDNEPGRGREARSDDAYSRRRSNPVIWIALAVLVAIALYVLVMGLGYASG